MKKYIYTALGLPLGFVLSFLLTAPLVAAVLPEQSSSKNVVINKDFTICQSVEIPTIEEARALPVTVRVDGTTMTVTPTWTATPGSTTEFQVNIPLKTLPAAQQANGRHDFTISVGGFLLADGSTTQPTVSSDYYVVVPDTGPKVGPLRWLRIAGMAVVGVATAIGLLR